MSTTITKQSCQGAMDVLELTIEFPIELVERLSKSLKMQGKTHEEIASEVLAEAVEDIADTIIAKDEIEAIRTGKSKLRTWEEAGLDF